MSATQHTDTQDTPQPRRPLEPATGALILLGSLAATAVAVFTLSRLFPFAPESFLLRRFSLTSEGLWLILGAWLLFPWALTAAFLRLARGVDPMRLTWAFAGVTYFLQSWAELVARDDISMWPELLFTALPALVFHKLAARNAPPENSETPDAANS